MNIPKNLIENDCHIIAGGAGFIGYNLAKSILSVKSNKVIILDNYSNKNIDKSYLEELSCENLEIKTLDIDNETSLDTCFKEITRKLDTKSIEIWHLAANSDIPSGVEDPNIDLRDTFMTTFNLLKTAKKYNVPNFNFASSSAIYGDHGSKQISEKTSPLMPISNYGAMKLASEAICFAALEDFLQKLRIYRFPNVVGVPATHGVIFDFIHKLIQDNKKLNVLGNGTQKKSYLHVEDLVNAMIYMSSIELKEHDSPIFNLGANNDLISVAEIANIVCSIVSKDAAIEYGSESRGWKGDIPIFSYDTSKAISYGWSPSMTSKEAVKKSAIEIYKHIKRIKNA